MNKKLKILFTNNAPLIKYGIASGFEKLGHEIFVMDGEYTLWDKPKKQQLKLFKLAIREFKPDICFSECFTEFSEDIFIYTKQMGIAHFFWSIEDTPHEHWIGDYWSDYADYIFTTTAECLPNYWSKNKSAELMLFACNPEYHRKIETDVVHDIMLVANNYDRREQQTKEFIIPLIEENYDLSVFGNHWWLDENRNVNLCRYPHIYKGYCSYENLPSLYSSTKIVMGQNLDGHSVTQTSMRMFEVLGIGGGILISPYTLAQQYLFHDHVYLPRNKDELFLMVDEVLSMTDSQRKEKAKSAQDYVYKYHNYTLRAQQVINAYTGIRG